MSMYGGGRGIKRRLVLVSLWMRKFSFQRVFLHTADTGFHLVSHGNQDTFVPWKKREVLVRTGYMTSKLASLK